MGMTAFRLRERQRRGELPRKAPPPPTSIPYEQHQEEIISWRKKASQLQTRITELEAENAELKALFEELAEGSAEPKAEPQAGAEPKAPPNPDKPKGKAAGAKKASQR